MGNFIFNFHVASHALPKYTIRGKGITVTVSTCGRRTPVQMSDKYVVETIWQIFNRNLVQRTVTIISVKYISRVRLYSMVVTKYKRKRPAVASRKLRAYYHSKRGPSSVVGIATGYGLEGPGIKSRWGRDFPHLSRPALGPIQHPVQ